MNKKFFWSLIVLLPLIFSACKTPPSEEASLLTPRGFLESILPNGDILELDSFEYGLTWKPFKSSTEYKDLSKDCQLSKEWQTEGEYSLLCSFSDSDNTNETKATFINNHAVETNWNNARFIVLLIKNPTPDCIYIGVGLDSYLSGTYPCPPGEHLLLININEFAETFNTNEPSASYVVNNITIYTDQIDTLAPGSRSFYIDNFCALIDNSKNIISDKNSNTLKPVDSE